MGSEKTLGESWEWTKDIFLAMVGKLAGSSIFWLVLIGMILFFTWKSLPFILNYRLEDKKDARLDARLSEQFHAKLAHRRKKKKKLSGPSKGRVTSRKTDDDKR